MKKSLMGVILLMLFLCSGCILTKIDQSIVYLEDDTFHCKEITADEAAVGDIKGEERKSYYFIPEKIADHTITQLGYPGVYYIGSGALSASAEKIYVPSTVEKCFKDYLEYVKYDEFSFLYCGKVFDLNHLCGFNNDIYVPKEQYSEFEAVFTGKKEHLKMANIAYDYNYEGKEYYYVDYIASGKKIVNIPPKPLREDYQFSGWYKDLELTIEFDFENDTVMLDNDSELRLYAKWE